MFGFHIMTLVGQVGTKFLKSNITKYEQTSVATTVKLIIN